MATSPLVQIARYKAKIDQYEQYGNEFVAPEIKLPQLLRRLKRGFSSKNVPPEVGRAFENAKKQLIELWSLFLISSPGQELPSDLVNLTVVEVVPPDRNMSEVIASGVEFLKGVTTPVICVDLLAKEILSLAPYTGLQNRSQRNLTTDLVSKVVAEETGFASGAGLGLTHSPLIVEKSDVLVRILLQFNAIIEKLKGRKAYKEAFLDVLRVLASISRDEICTENVSNFFKLVSCQMLILRDLDYSSIQEYKDNLTNLVAIKASIQKDFEVTPLYKDLLPCLDIFLEIITADQEILTLAKKDVD